MLPEECLKQLPKLKQENEALDNDCNERVTKVVENNAEDEDSGVKMTENADRKEEETKDEHSDIKMTENADRKEEEEEETKDEDSDVKMTENADRKENEETKDEDSGVTMTENADRKEEETKDENSDVKMTESADRKEEEETKDEDSDVKMTENADRKENEETKDEDSGVTMTENADRKEEEETKDENSDVKMTENADRKEEEEETKDEDIDVKMTGNEDRKEDEETKDEDSGVKMTGNTDGKEDRETMDKDSGVEMTGNADYKEDEETLDKDCGLKMTGNTHRKEDEETKNEDCVVKITENAGFKEDEETKNIRPSDSKQVEPQTRQLSAYINKAFDGSGEEELGIETKGEDVLDVGLPNGVRVTNGVHCGTPEIRASKTRFWILIMYSVLCFLHVWQWNNWGPISETVLKVFVNWDESTVAMLANWGTITFLVFIVPICWVIHRHGLRLSLLINAIVMAVGAVLRCIYINDSEFTIMAHVGAILIGIPGTMVLAAPSVIAATWFPPHERTTATAFSQVICQLGGVGSFLEPLYVSSPKSDATDEKLFNDVMRLMYICAGINVAFLLMVLAYFPNKPKIAPSISSSMDHLNLIPSIKAFVRSRSAWMIMFSYGINTGVSVIWVSVMSIVVLPLGIRMDEAMWLGVIAIVCSGLAALISGHLTDRLSGNIKVSLLGLMVCSMVCYFWLFLLTTDFVTVTKWQVYVSITLGMSFSFACVPLFFELSVEILYPCSDIVCGSFLTFVENLVGVLFLLIFFINDIGYSWVVYTLLGANAVAIIPILFVQEVYKRSTVDGKITGM